MIDTNPEPADPNQFRKGSIRHETLPSDLLEHIRVIHDVIGDYLDTTLGQFERNFMRDSNPEVGVALWSCIAAAWITYHEQHLCNMFLPNEEEKRLLGALLAISSGVEDANKLGVPADVGEKLLACYDGLGK